jgi:hypothetical protein
MNATPITFYLIQKLKQGFSYTIFPVKKNKCWKDFKIMRKLLFNYSFYSHPEIGNFRVWQRGNQFFASLLCFISWNCFVLAVGEQEGTHGRKGRPCRRPGEESHTGRRCTHAAAGEEQRSSEKAGEREGARAAGWKWWPHHHRVGAMVALPLGRSKARANAGEEGRPHRRGEEGRPHKGRLCWAPRRRSGSG